MLFISLLPSFAPSSAVRNSGHSSFCDIGWLTRIVFLQSRCFCNLSFCYRIFKNCHAGFCTTFHFYTIWLLFFSFASSYKFPGETSVDSEIIHWHVTELLARWLFLNFKPKSIFQFKKNRHSCHLTIHIPPCSQLHSRCRDLWKTKQELRHSTFHPPKYFSLNICWSSNDFHWCRLWILFCNFLFSFYSHQIRRDSHSPMVVYHPLPTCSIFLVSNLQTGPVKKHSAMLRHRNKFITHKEEKNIQERQLQNRFRKWKFHSTVDYQMVDFKLFFTFSVHLRQTLYCKF